MWRRLLRAVGQRCHSRSCHACTWYVSCSRTLSAILLLEGALAGACNDRACSWALPRHLAATHSRGVPAAGTRNMHAPYPTYSLSPLLSLLQTPHSGQLQLFDPTLSLCPC
jgi:hypothetical protein